MLPAGQSQDFLSTNLSSSSHNSLAVVVAPPPRCRLQENNLKHKLVGWQSPLTSLTDPSLDKGHHRMQLKSSVKFIWKEVAHRMKSNIISISYHIIRKDTALMKLCMTVNTHRTFRLQSRSTMPMTPIQGIRPPGPMIEFLYHYLYMIVDAACKSHIPSVKWAIETDSEFLYLKDITLHTEVGTSTEDLLLLRIWVLILCIFLIWNLGC